jgi:hypothetical protein
MYTIDMTFNYSIFKYNWHSIILNYAVQEIHLQEYKLQAPPQMLLPSTKKKLKINYEYNRDWSKKRNKPI